ncbi:hypothetical protein [Deinococcus hohokamensis]|uniref:Uncharacterized protein n=1 Tax=Deinococcus hohokamensis TaxID=309883 RepID=A0ABV9IDC0_9DEIO
MVAAVEFAPVLSAQRPTRELLLDFVAQVERNAADFAQMDRHGGTDIAALGEDVYGQLTVQREESLRVAYHAQHSAAFLGLERGLTTATMLAAVAYALRVLAQREGQLPHLRRLQTGSGQRVSQVDELGVQALMVTRCDGVNQEVSMGRGRRQARA